MNKEYNREVMTSYNTICIFKIIQIHIIFMHAFSYFFIIIILIFSEFGHFTQVVWKRTSAIGIGKACKDGKTVIVGTYNPPGNLQGSFAANVSPVFLY